MYQNNCKMCNVSKTKLVCVLLLWGIFPGVIGDLNAFSLVDPASSVCSFQGIMLVCITQADCERTVNKAQGSRLLSPVRENWLWGWLRTGEAVASHVSWGRGSGLVASWPVSASGLFLEFPACPIAVTIHTLEEPTVCSGLCPVRGEKAYLSALYSFIEV